MESDGTSAGRSSESRRCAEGSGFYNKLGWFKLDEDGQLGSKTREAIQKVQQKAKLQPDGYPDYQLLNKINKYNPDIGFAVPVQPRKLHRRK